MEKIRYKGQVYVRCDADPQIEEAYKTARKVHSLISEVSRALDEPGFENERQAALKLYYGWDKLAAMIKRKL